MATYLARMLHVEKHPTLQHVRPAISRLWAVVVTTWASGDEAGARKTIADVSRADLRDALRERLAEHMRAWQPVRALLDAGDIEGARQAAANFDGPHRYDIRAALKAKVEHFLKATRHD